MTRIVVIDDWPSDEWWHRLGERMYCQGKPDPIEGANAFQSRAYFIRAGWYAAMREDAQKQAQKEQEAGLDYESLDKLANQLKALGFTIPNEEK